MTPTHNLPSELGNAGCEIVDEAGDLVIIDVGREGGFVTLPREWLTEIPGAIAPLAELPSQDWIGRDKDSDVWVHFQRGWFMRPGSKEPESWAGIQKYGPFKTITGKQNGE